MRWSEADHGDLCKEFGKQRARTNLLYIFEAAVVIVERSGFRQAVVQREQALFVLLGRRNEISLAQYIGQKIGKEKFTGRGKPEATVFVHGIVVQNAVVHFVGATDHDIARLQTIQPMFYHKRGVSLE